MAVSTTCSDAIAYIRLCALANRSKMMQHYLHIQFIVRYTFGQALRLPYAAAQIVYLAFYITLLINLDKTICKPSMS